MTDPFLAFQRNAETDETEPVMASEFDWDELALRMERDEKPGALLAEARQEGGREMLSQIVAVCAEGVMQIRGKSTRVEVVGLRLLCAAAVLRPGQAMDRSVRTMAKATGINVSHIHRVIKQMRARIGNGYHCQ